MVTKASKPSESLIFFPSLYSLPLYEIGISFISSFNKDNFVVNSGQKLKPSSFKFNFGTRFLLKTL